MSDYPVTELFSLVCLTAPSQGIAGFYIIDSRLRKKRVDTHECQFPSIMQLVQQGKLVLEERFVILRFRIFQANCLNCCGHFPSLIIFLCSIPLISYQSSGYSVRVQYYSVFSRVLFFSVQNHAVSYTLINLFIAKKGALFPATYLRIPAHFGQA